MLSLAATLGTTHGAIAAYAMAHLGRTCAQRFQVILASSQAVRMWRWRLDSRGGGDGGGLLQGGHAADGLLCVTR